MKKIKKGPIYMVVNFLVEVLKYFTLVELFKFVGKHINPHKNVLEYRLAYSRTSVDLFILFKWLLVLVLSYFSVTCGFFTFIVWYLLITNLYTYFYYHLWCNDAFSSSNMDIDRLRRRFINLLLAVFYSNLCFAYLFKVPYKDHFDWSGRGNSFENSVWFSFSNSIAANYDVVKPLTNFGYDLSMIQLIVTFIFVAVILGKSNS